MNKKDKPLTVEVKDDQLIISVGINTLAFCTTSNNGGPLNETQVIVEPGFEEQWAKDIVYEMEHENNGGEPPLYKFLDEMMIEACEAGSSGLKFLDNE